MLGFTVCKAENQFAVILSKSEGLRIGTGRQEMMRGISTGAENYGLLCGRAEDKHSSSRREGENLPSTEFAL